MGLKRILLLALLAVLAVGFYGCKKKEAPKEGDGGMAEKMTEEAKEAVGTAKEAMVEAKDKFVSECQNQCDQLKEKFSELKAKADSEGADAQKEYSEMKADFDEKMEAVSREMGQLKSASADAWMDCKEPVSKAIDDLKAAYDKAAARFAGGQ